MTNRFRVSLVIAIVTAACVFVWTQTGNAVQTNRWANVIAQLLDHPAPPPPMLKEVTDVIGDFSKLVSEEINERTQEPAENASPRQVVRFWEWQGRRESGKQPSEKARWQLLETCLQNEHLDCAWVRDYFPDTPAAHQRVKAYLDDAKLPVLKPDSAYEPLNADERKRHKEWYRYWLMRHSNFFRDELLQAAREVSASGYQLNNQSNLEALARLDWKAAKPIIEGYVKQPEPYVQTFALKLLYLQAVENGDSNQADALRRRLLEIVTNPQTSEYARSEAYDALTQREWPGRNEWFSALLAKENLLEVKNALFNNGILANPIKAAPEIWNPLLAQLVASGNQTVHDNAALILVSVALRKPNREALLPLLPWLINPKWVTAGDEYDRYRVIEAAGNLQLPEAVPGLLWIVQNEKAYVVTKASQALSNYRDPQAIAKAVPVLRSAIRKEPVDESLTDMIRFLVIHGGLDDVQIISALESLAEKTEPRFEIEFIINDRETDWMPYFLEGESLSLDGWIGHALMWQHKYGQRDSAGIRKSPFTETVAAGLIARSKTLQTERPDVAAKLWMIASVLEFPVVYSELAERIVGLDFDLATLLIALKRRQQVSAVAGSTLQPMLRQSGYALGVGTVLLDDEDKARSILESSDREAQVALLACARVMRVALSVEQVGKLLTATDKQLALAAERYLESEDSPVARKLILARHPNEALILGGSPDFNPKRKHWVEWDKWEDALREDVKQGQAEEVFGEMQVHTSDAGGPESFWLEVHVRGQQAVSCRRKDAARKECRSLTSEELSAMRDLFNEARFDELQPLSVPGSGYGGVYQEFIWLNKQGGRRVFTANLGRLHSESYGWGMQQQTPHNRINKFFAKLKTTGDYELRYALKEKIKELEVVSADDKLPVSQVCGENGEVRALVKDDPGYYAQPKWKAVKEGKLGGDADQPPLCPCVDRREDLPEAMRNGAVYAYPLWKTQTKDGIVRSMTWNEQHALWFVTAGSEPRLLTKESEQPEAVTPDGRWLIAIKRNREAGSDLLRIDLKTGATTKIEVEGWTYPIVVEPLTGRIVIPTFRDNRKIYEVKLYSPDTGKLETGVGEFEPIKHQNYRSLQPITGTTTEFWAAIPDPDAKKTRVGRYDARGFKFTSLMELPEIVFNSTSMWVDEKSDWLYIAYNGHLLRLPFPPRSSGQEKR
ncbi:MAG: HEAT repeat domain-containing protein [Acidobacteriota bacterium]|nr:HEAT repeat domain-containing protein [Acidobacteriota bacterium]